MVRRPVLSGISRCTPIGVALLVAAKPALACPSCAGNPDGGVARYLLIGLMILAPYVASVVVIRVIKKGEAALSAREPREANTTD